MKVGDIWKQLRDYLVGKFDELSNSPNRDNIIICLNIHNEGQKVPISANDKTNPQLWEQWRDLYSSEKSPLPYKSHFEKSPLLYKTALSKSPMLSQTDYFKLRNDILETQKEFGTYYTSSQTDSQKGLVTSKTFSRLLKTLSIGIKIIAITFSLIVIFYESSYKSPDNHCYAAVGDFYPVQKIQSNDGQSYTYFKGSE